jgi:hypothetical protein
MKSILSRARHIRRLVVVVLTVGVVGWASAQSAVAQVGLPTDQQPAQGSLWDSIFGPVMPLLSGAWWIVLHLLLPLGLIGGVIGMVVASISGNRDGVARARGVIMAVPMALFFVSAAVLVSNWIISNY